MAECDTRMSTSGNVKTSKWMPLIFLNIMSENLVGAHLGFSVFVYASSEHHKRVLYRCDRKTEKMPIKRLHVDGLGL